MGPGEASRTPATHPPASARRAETARRRLSRPGGNARARPRACPLPWIIGPGFPRRGSLPRTACADSSAPSRSARTRRRRPRVSLGRRDSRPPARPPTSPRLMAPAPPSAGLPLRSIPEVAHSAETSSSAPEARNRRGGCRAKTGRRGRREPPPVAGEQRERERAGISTANEAPSSRNTQSRTLHIGILIAIQKDYQQ